jgi:ABC-type antimicrobial peptide transport system permease subunit
VSTSSSKPLDYVWAFLAAVILSFLGSLLGSFIGFYIFLLAPAAGVAVAEVVRLLTRKRRSTKLFKLVRVAVVLGSLPLALVGLLNFSLDLIDQTFTLYSVLPFVYQMLYMILAAPSAYYRLSGRRRP